LFVCYNFSQLQHTDTSALNSKFSLCAVCCWKHHRPV